jgi:hypothetical protein
MDSQKRPRPTPGRWKQLREHTPGRLSKAVAQGVSPELWNVIGTIGLILSGVALTSIKVKCVHQVAAKAANRVLIVAFEVGLLGYGIIATQLFFEFRQTSVPAWQAWFFGIEITFLIVVVLLLNCLLWYLSCLVFREDVGKLSQLDWPIPIAIGVDRWSAELSSPSK